MKLTRTLNGGRKRYLAIAALTLFGLLAACKPPPTAPSITRFEAVPDAIELGQTSEIRWTVLGASSIALRLEGDTLVDGTEGEGTYSFAPTEIGDFEFELVATNVNGSTTRTVGITVTDGTVPDLRPSIVTFASSEDEVRLLDTATIEWQVTDADQVELALDGVDVLTDAGLEGTHEFTPLTVGEFTFVLTASNAHGTREAELTITSWADPEVTSISATVVRGSRLHVTWEGHGDQFDVLAVGPGDVTEMVMAGVAEKETEVPIPASDYQTLRVVAHAGATTDSRDLSLGGLPIVIRSDDYDPFASLGWTPDLPVPGTLRYWIDFAAPGSTIGFAQDINIVNVRGVEVALNPLWTPEGPAPANFDTHLAVKQDLIISGPTTRVVIEASSVSDDPDEDIAFMYRSRAVLINHGVTATLENLVITGGTYISNGAGVRNNGTLTIENSQIVGNRAWDKGGGLFNDVGANLTVIDTLIADNQAVTLAEEVGTQSQIRNSDPVEFPEGQFSLPDGGYGGGLFSERDGTVTIVDSTFENNYAKISGGAIFNEPAGTITMEGGSIEGNVANFSSEVPAVDPPTWYFSYGGGVLNAGYFELSNSQVTANDAYEQGGGLYQGIIGEAHFSGVTVSGNAADWGGGVRNHYCETNFFQEGGTIAGNIGRLGGPVTANLYATEGDATECSTGDSGGESALYWLGLEPTTPSGPSRER